MAGLIFTLGQYLAGPFLRPLTGKIYNSVLNFSEHSLGLGSDFPILLGVLVSVAPLFLLNLLSKKTRDAVLQKNFSLLFSSFLFFSAGVVFAYVLWGLTLAFRLRDMHFSI